MDKTTIKIVMAGHIDHGKSTLIGRLLLETNSLPKEKIAEIKAISKKLGKDTELAYLADYLKEERENNMTIDTTQVFFKTRKKNYVLIDTPGHLEFIKNMLTGATQADAAVFLIDINAGIQEQTRRHAYILKLLGINTLIGVFNKMDLVRYEQKKFAETKIEFLNFLSGLGIKPDFIIPVSAKEGANISRGNPKMNWYKGPSLLDALDALKCGGEPEEKTLRFPIQDVYKNGNEKIVVGKISSGLIKQGQAITLLPSLQNTRVNSIRIFGKNVKQAGRGENIGLVLDNSARAERGEIIAPKGAPLKPTVYFKGLIFWISRSPLKINQILTLRCSTQEAKVSVERIEKRINTATLEILEENASGLNINEAAMAVLKTESPVIVENFALMKELGRFIIEHGPDLSGVGIVTDV